MSERPTAVLDASALLAYLQDEPGAASVEEALGAGVVMSAANWAEVLTKLADVGHEPTGFAQSLREEGLLGAALRIVPLDEAAATAIAGLRPKTKASGLSLGDRACLALGLSTGLPVLTTDRAWLALKIRGLKIVLTR